MLTYQQARAAIVRAAIHGYTRDELAALLRRLTPDRRLSPNASVLSLAYSIAWALLPAYDDRSAS